MDSFRDALVRYRRESDAFYDRDERVSSDFYAHGISTSFDSRSNVFHGKDDEPLFVSTFFTLILPLCALPILTGLRLGLAIGWRVLIAAEMVVGSSVGLGYAIIPSRWSLDFEVVFISIGLICAVGIVAEKWGFRVLEKKILQRVGNG